MDFDGPENFVLHSKTCDAEPPTWPHIVCADGYAWHPDHRKRQCFRGFTHGAPTELIAAVMHGRPIDRVWAVRRLLVGAEPGDQCWPGALVVIWPGDCDGCGKSHLKVADLWRRAALSLHPGAVEDLRAANPPLRLLLDPDLPADRRHKIGHPRVRSGGIPVRDTSEATERAQIAWGIDIRARREFPLPAQTRKRRIVRDVAAK